MNRVKLSFWAGAALCSMPVYAGEFTLEALTVSASKIEQSTLEAPVNVSVITSEDIGKVNAQRIGDVINARVPGVYMRGASLGNSRPGVGSTLTMRGQGGNLSRTAVLVDGMNMVDAYSGAINWAMVSMEDIENIEVVPGVGSALYGSNAMGGVISIKTKDPIKEELSLNIGQGFDDADGNYASALYRNKFANGLGIVIGGSFNNREGYPYEYVTKTPSGNPAGGAVVVTGAVPNTTPTGSKNYIVGDRGNNASKSKNVHAKLVYDLDKASKVHVGFAYSDNESITRPYNSYLKNGSGDPISIGSTATNLNIDGKASSIREQDFAGSVPMGNTVLRYFGGYEGEIEKTKININLGKIDRDTWNSSIGSTATLSSGAGTLSTTPNTTTNGSAQIGFALGESQYLIAGLATEIAEMHQKKYAVANWTDMNSKTSLMDRSDAKSTINSLYFQDQISVGENFLVYLGGRYDSWKANGSGEVITGSYPGTFNYSESSDSQFSPKGAIVYMPTEKLSIKSSLGTGFRVPTNFYLYSNPTFSGTAPNGKIIYSNPNLKPEKSLAFDIGMEYHFPEGGKVIATYFMSKTTDMIYQKVTKVPTYTDTNINKVIDYEGRQENTGESQAKGIELAGEYPIEEWLRVRGSYAYTNSKITEDNTDTNMMGKYVINIPKHLASVGLEVDQGPWNAILSGRYVGELYTSNDNSDVVKDVWTGYSKYAIMDMKVDYKINQNIKASMMIDNFFDLEYYEYYRMPGRTLTLQLSALF